MSDSSETPPRLAGLTIDVEAALHREGEVFAFELAEALANESQRERFPSDVSLSDVRVEGSFSAVNGVVFVKASASALVRTQCARCLNDVGFQATADVSESFGRETDANDDDAERCVFAGNVIDLAECVYSAILLALPMRSLCRYDCRGLCPVCGINLNEATCACD